MVLKCELTSAEIYDLANKLTDLTIKRDPDGGMCKNYYRRENLFDKVYQVLIKSSYFERVN